MSAVATNDGLHLSGFDAKAIILGLQEAIKYGLDEVEISYVSPEKKILRSILASLGIFGDGSNESGGGGGGTSKSVERAIGYFFGKVEYEGKKYDLSALFEFRGWENKFNIVAGIGSKFAALISYDMSTDELVEFKITETPDNVPYEEQVNLNGEDFTARGWFSVNGQFEEQIEEMFGKEATEVWNTFVKDNKAFISLRNILPLNKEIWFNNKEKETNTLILTHFFTLTVPQGPAHINVDIGVLKLRFDFLQANLYQGYYKKPK